jgi:hypothetical protein
MTPAIPVPTEPINGKEWVNLSPTFKYQSKRKIQTFDETPSGLRAWETSIRSSCLQKFGLSFSDYNHLVEGTKLAPPSIASSLYDSIYDHVGSHMQGKIPNMPEHEQGDGFKIIAKMRASYPAVASTERSDAIKGLEKQYDAKESLPVFLQDMDDYFTQLEKNGVPYNDTIKKSKFTDWLPEEFVNLACPNMHPDSTDSYEGMKAAILIYHHRSQSTGETSPHQDHVHL